MIDPRNQPINGTGDGHENDYPPTDACATRACDCRSPTTATAIHPIPLTVVVLTYQEEANLSDCLASVVGWVQRILVVDSGSQDRTISIARHYGTNVLHHPFESHTRQWRWAIDALNKECAGSPAPWVLGLDADQRVTLELRSELCSLFTSAGATKVPEDVEGFYIKRRQIFRGRWIRYGGYYPKHLLKLFRADKVRFDDNDLVDHHFYLMGKIGTLRHDLIEDNRKEYDISFWIDKHNRYAAKLAEEEHGRRDRKNSAFGLVAPALFGNRDQRTLWLKLCWSRLPLYIRPFLYFMYRYVLRFGFLDGRQGLVFHFLHACWFRFLIDVHLDQLRRHHVSDASNSGSTVDDR